MDQILMRTLGVTFLAILTHGLTAEQRARVVAEVFDMADRRDGTADGEILRVIALSAKDREANINPPSSPPPQPRPSLMLVK